MTLHQLPTEEQRFCRSVTNSWPAVWKVAQYLHRQGGCIVQINPLLIRPTFEQRASFGDAADILVQKVGGADWWKVCVECIEVKGRQIHFTNAYDYPFGTIIIDRVAKADTAKPDIYYIVNKALTHAAKIDATTKSQWITDTKSDSTKGYDFTAYECPKQLAVFVGL